MESNDRPVNIKIQESSIVPVFGEVENAVVPTSVSVMNTPKDDANISYITDGKPETYYTLDENSSWVELDLGINTEIAGVALSLNEQGNYKIMYSQDGTNFTQVYSGLSAGKSGYELLPIWGRARYVRFVGMGNVNGDDFVGLAEFCAYYPLETQTIGSGIPRALIHKDGNYEFEIQNYGEFEVTYPDGAVQVVTPGDGSTTSRESWVFVKYPMDANTGTYTFNFNLRIYGGVTAVNLHLYDKQNIAANRYIKNAALLKSNLTWNTAQNTNARKFNDLTFSIDTNTGYYSGKLDGVAFSALGDNVYKIDDLSAGIGMIGIQIVSASADWGTGVGFKSASVTHSANGTLGSGIPSENPVIKNGDFEAMLVHFGYPYRIENCDDGRVMIANGDDVNVWKSDIQIKNNKVHNSENSGTLTFEFGVNAVGNTFNTGSFIEIYNKNNVKISTIQNLLYSTGEWNLSGNTPSSMNPIVLKLKIDLKTGTWTLYGGDYQFNGGSGTIDVSNGIGLVNFEAKVNEGGKVSINSLKLTETSKVLSYANDHYTYIDGVPNIGSTYKNTVLVTDESKSSSTITAQNGVLVMSGTDARLQFTRIMDTDFNKKIYIEAIISANKALTNANSTIQFNAMAADGTYQISGQSSQFASNDFSNVNNQYVIGIVVDMKSNTYSLVQNGIITKTGTIAENNKDIKWLWLGFSDKTGAKLTIHNLKYMDIEPINYDIKTGTYFNIDSVLLNGIAHYAGVTSWSENGVSFFAEKNGTVTMTKHNDCEGIVFTGSQGKDNYARLSVAYDFDITNFADTYASVRWEFNLAGSDEQNICVASRTSDGKFPVNKGGAATAGDHVAELEYNPSTCEYIYYFDGVKSGKYKLDEASLSNLFLEWYSDNANDVLTLKNISVRKLTDNAEDKFDITLSDDYKTANAVVTIEKKFSTAAGRVSFFIASYDGNELKAVNVYEASLDTGTNNLKVSLDNLNGGKEVRVFLWKENTLMPLAWK